MALFVATPLTEAEKARLASLRLRATRFEAVLERLDDGAIAETWLLGYSGRRSRSGLMELVRQNGPRILVAVEIADDDVLRFNRDKSVMLSASARVRFSGRSERGCICSGEQPALPSAKK